MLPVFGISGVTVIDAVVKLSEHESLAHDLMVCTSVVVLGVVHKLSVVTVTVKEDVATGQQLFSEQDVMVSTRVYVTVVGAMVGVGICLGTGTVTVCVALIHVFSRHVVTVCVVVVIAGGKTGAGGALQMLQVGEGTMHGSTTVTVTVPLTVVRAVGITVKVSVGAVGV